MTYTQTVETLRAWKEANKKYKTKKECKKQIEKQKKNISLLKSKIIAFVLLRDLFKKNNK